ncbi:hypothetical protein V494_03245 [Pseudogymnoascus sp. VKM F-4513 (FW-928)]|nr:hypothetical protein V494_03245 [Pseudogymnoascus sp. VKM F-4513 (FW-928)]
MTFRSSSAPTSVAANGSEDNIVSISHTADGGSEVVRGAGPIFRSATPACVALKGPVEKTPWVTMAERYVGCACAGKRVATSSTAPMPFWVKRIVDSDERRGRRGVIAAAAEGDLVVRRR